MDLPRSSFPRSPFNRGASPRCASLSECPFQRLKSRRAGIKQRRTGEETAGIISAARAAEKTTGVPPRRTAARLT